MTNTDHHKISLPRFDAPPGELLSNCNCCPRDCRVDRNGAGPGFCGSDADFAVSSICAHCGEEPVLSGQYGICNIFFTHCNMQCVFCQNYQISDNKLALTADYMSLDDIVLRVEEILAGGAKGVGFVSPSHVIPQARQIMTALRQRGQAPTYVYNTNGYDRVEMIKSMEGEFDVYLPDLKYMDNSLAGKYSATPDYVEYATCAVREMYRQKGAEIVLDENGLITSGLIIRHLVLPGHIDNSKKVLQYIARELSPDIYISLMSQYYPTARVANHPNLRRTLYAAEYEEVMEEFERLGFHRGFVQEMSSPYNYRPDFLKDRPFDY